MSKRHTKSSHIFISITVARYGGGRTVVYLADAGRKLVALPDAFHAYDDAGGIFEEWVFLPRQAPMVSGL